MPKANVSEAIRHILISASLASVAAAAVPALAADPVDEESGLEEIVVTGSRVRGAEPVGAPVLTLGRDDISAAGQVTVDRILKEIPQNFDLGVSENSRGQAGGNGNIVYGNTVNLRGIGPFATLVLVDGHRVTNNSRSTDPSVLPTLGVERVEVFADGASAIYGSDAVAGVVNIIPRRSLDGVEVFGRYGFAEEGEFDESVLGFAAGKVWSSGQGMLAYEHAHRHDLSGDDREFFVGNQVPFGGRDYRTTRCNPGTLRLGTTATSPTFAMPAGGLTQANVGSLVPGANRCNEFVGQDLIPEQTYDSVNGTLTQEITDWVEVFADAFYSKREFVRNPAYASATLNVPQTNAWFVRPTGFTGTSYQIDYSFINDLPRNFSEGFAKNWQVTPGLRFKLGSDWEIEALVGYGGTSDDSSSYYGTNNTALTAALASNNPDTAFDPYGLSRTSASVRALVANQIFFAPTKNDFTGYELRGSGTLFKLPGGPLGLAVGAERQENDVALGSARGAPTTPMAWRYFSRDVNSAYAELLIPIFGAENAVTGFQELRFDAAVRYDDYSDVGNTTNSKFSLSWRPIESLKLHASWGTAFRAPLISEIYGNSNNLFNQSYQNPAGGPNIPGTALSGQNLDLGPEEATTWTAGIEWQPLPQLKLGATYFDILYENQVIANLSNLTILNQEADYAGTGIILRGAAAGARVAELLAQGITVAAGTFPVAGNPNSVTLFVDGRSQNLARSDTTGLDFQAAYALPTESAGNFTFTVAGTWMLSYDVAITAIANAVDRYNTIFNPLELKARATVAWQRGPLQASMTINRVNGYQNNAITPAEHVGAWTPVDLSFGWNIAEGMSWTQTKDLLLGFEVRNAFDEDPPYVNLAPNGNGSGGYDATAASPVGRLYGFSLRMNW